MLSIVNEIGNLIEVESRSVIMVAGECCRRTERKEEWGKVSISHDKQRAKEYSK